MINSMEKIYKSRKYDRACSSDIREFSSYFIKKKCLFHLPGNQRERERDFSSVGLLFKHTAARAVTG